MKIKKLDLNDPKTKAEFDRVRAEVDEQFRPLIEANEASSRITAEDLAVTINTTEPLK